MSSSMLLKALTRRKCLFHLTPPKSSKYNTNKENHHPHCKKKAYKLCHDAFLCCYSIHIVSYVFRKDNVKKENNVKLTHMNRCNASGWECEYVKDWSLSVESSRNVVTPSGKIGATVAKAATANGIGGPATVCWW